MANKTGRQPTTLERDEALEKTYHCLQWSQQDLGRILDKGNWATLEDFEEVSDAHHQVTVALGAVMNVMARNGILK